MKKFRVILLSTLIFVMFVSSAQAISISSVNYDGGRLSWSVSDFSSYSVEVDGSHLVGDVVSGTGSKKVELAAGSHTLTVFNLNGDKDSKSFSVGAVEPPVETATPTPVATEEPTPTPVATEEPTPTPVITEEPSQDPTKEPTDPTKEPSDPTKAPTAKPTKAPATTDDDDVPKTGDATTTFLFVIVAMMVLAAGALTAMRVASRRK